jgi:hypothetical protein
MDGDTSVLLEDVPQRIRVEALVSEQASWPDTFNESTPFSARAMGRRLDATIGRSR